jgi:predicted TIM-barrel fold metal-dependent hydrolase
VAPLSLDEVVGIDVHVHMRGTTAPSDVDERGRYFREYFGNKKQQAATIDELAEEYRAHKMMAVLLNGTDITVTGRVPMPNDDVAAAVRAHPDVFIGFGVVDPWQGKLALDEIRRCKEELGLVGIGELNPARQHFFPNEQRFYPLWKLAEDLEMPVMFHTGMAAVGAGAPGGLGVKLKYTQPMLLDDVAADFPALKIIAAHPSWPWEAESLAIARHKANYFIDLSGWAPKYWSPELVKYVNSVIQDKAMFGSDSPALDLDRWLSEFAAMTFKEDVRKKIMRENAIAFFGLK